MSNANKTPEYNPSDPNNAWNFCKLTIFQKLKNDLLAPEIPVLIKEHIPFAEALKISDAYWDDPNTDHKHYYYHSLYQTPG